MWDFLSVFAQSRAGGVEVKLSEDFEAAGYEVVPGLGVVDQKLGLSKDQNAVVAFGVKGAESGDKDAIRNIGQAFPVFAGIGCVEAVKVCLRLSEPTSVELAGVWGRQVGVGTWGSSSFCCLCLTPRQEILRL